MFRSVAVLLLFAIFPLEGMAQDLQPLPYGPRGPGGPAGRLLASVPKIPGVEKLIGQGRPFEDRYYQLLSQDEQLAEAALSLREAVLLAEGQNMRPFEVTRFNQQVRMNLVELRAAERRHVAEVWQFVRTVERPAYGSGMIRIGPGGTYYRH